MRLVTAARSGLFVLLLLLSLAEARGQTAVGRRVFRIPYAGAGESRPSNALLSVPFVRIGEPWATFSRRSPRTEEEAALQGLLAAVYRGDAAAAAPLVNPPAEAAQGKAFEAYVEAFKASLERAGDLEVEGYFPLKGRVRFVLRPARAGERHRLLTLRPGPQGRLRFDETQAPGKVDAVLNTIFRAPRESQLEVPGATADGRLTVTVEETGPNGVVELSVKARLVNADLKQLEPRLAGPFVQFYKECVTPPEAASMERYLRCLQPDLQPRLREGFAGMGAERQGQLLAAVYSPRRVDFVVENPSSEVIFYRNTSGAASGRDWVERAPGGGFVLLNPLTSFPLDDLLSSAAVRAALAGALDRAAAAQAK